MAAYQKPQDVVYNYNTATTRPDQASTYATYAQPQYDASYLNPHTQVPSALPNTPDMPIMSADQYQAHDASYAVQDASYQPYIATAGSRPLTQVTTFQPTQGPAGRRLHVYLNSSDDLETTQQYLTIVFGSRRVQGMLQKLSTQTHQQGNYVFSVDVPAFDSTGSSNTQIPLYLDLGDGSNPMSFGAYQYTDATAFGIASPSPSLSRKRKLSVDMAAAGSPSLSKRTSSNALSADFEHSSPSTQSALSPFGQASQNGNYAYGQPRPQSYGVMPQTSQATPRYGVSPQTTASHLNVSSSAYPYGPGAYLANRSPVPQNSMIGQVTGSGASNPTLVRTSTLNGDIVGPAPIPTSYNPYSYQSNSKAILKLDGDLNSMTDNWKPDEVATQRRLVRFTRSQTGSTITAQFQPVTLEDHAKAPGHIYVNCIFWKEKQACYITSVDTIQLLESLVAVRFTVEEKNRIRRNLEGFRPATVSKTRADCEEFFKTIMGFPSPKPRNIEKDVKVFPWRILAHALKKIIGKYSASYSSTAASIAPGMTGHSASASGSNGNHGRPAASPPSGSAHASSLQYGVPNMPVTSMSSAGPILGSNGPPPASMGQSMSWHTPSSNYTTDMSTRPNWDYSGQYMQAGQPQNSGHAAAQAITAGGRDYRIPSFQQNFGSNYYMSAGGQDFQRQTQI